MEDIDDDDFGDLYTDVEVQASSAVSRIQSFTPLGMKEEVDDDNDNDSGILNSDWNGVDINGDAESDGVLAVENGSDSEDDLNIVLDDGGGVEVQVVDLRSKGIESEEEKGGFEHCTDGGGSGNGGKGRKILQYSRYKFTRPNSALVPSHSKANGFEEFTSSMLVRSDQDFTGCNQRMSSSSLSCRSGLNFSLPRSRTILDVNIDRFEHKPWRHAGENITDFFNFGFDEETWKLYCNCLDQCRKLSTMTRILPHSPLKCKEACNSGSKNEIHAQEVASGIISPWGQGKMVGFAISRFSCREQKQSGVLFQPKGRAIQVEDSISERQPSMDVRCSIDRDSDVVIQIKVQDSKADDSSGSAMKGLDPPVNSIHDVSESRDIKDVCGDVLSFGSANDEEIVREQLEGHSEESDLPVAERCPEQATVCPVSMNSDKNESVQISDVDGVDYERVTISDNEGTSKELETSNNTEKGFGRDEACPSPSVLDTESCHGEWSQRSPESFAHHSETFREGAIVDSKKSYHVKSSSPLINELVTSDRCHSWDSKTWNIKPRKPGDDKYHSRYRGPIREDLKHFDDLDNYPLSDTNRLSDLHHSEVVHGRRKRNLHDFDSCGREDFIYHTKFKPSCKYYGEKFPDLKIRSACTKYPHWKVQRNTDQYFHRNSDEHYYYHEERLPGVNDEVMERDWHRYEIDIDSLTSKNSRCLTSKHCSHVDNERGTRWKRKEDELNFGKRIKSSDHLFDRKCNGNLLQENYRSSVQYNDKDILHSKYNHERYVSYSRREDKSPRNCRRYGDPCIGSDSLLCNGGADEHSRFINYQSNCSRSCEEPRLANGRRWRNNMSTRKYLYDRHRRHWKQIWSEKHINDDDWFDSYDGAFGVEENMNDEPHSANGRRWCDSISQRNNLYDRHGGRKRQIWSEKPINDDYWFDGYNGTFGVEESMNDRHSWVHFELNRQHLHLSDDEYILRYGDDKFQSEGLTYLFERNSRCKNSDGQYGDDKFDAIGGLISEGSSGYQRDKSINITHRDRHVRCKDSVDLFVGEGKSNGRCIKDGSFLYTDRHEKMDCNIAFEQKTLKNPIELQDDVGQANYLKAKLRQNDKKVPDKYSVADQNEAINIEEGQIISKETEIPVEKECPSEDVAQNDDWKKLHGGSVVKGNMVAEGYDNPRILEIIAKMEKRRERFKKPITVGQDSERTPKLLVDSVETKQQRPVRKRRWSGNLEGSYSLI